MLAGLNIRNKVVLSACYLAASSKRSRPSTMVITASRRIVVVRLRQQVRHHRLWRAFFVNGLKRCQYLSMMPHEARKLVNDGETQSGEEHWIRDSKTPQIEAQLRHGAGLRLGPPVPFCAVPDPGRPANSDIDRALRRSLNALVRGRADGNPSARRLLPAVPA